MPNNRYEGRPVLIDKITNELGAFHASVQAAIKNNLPSYNVVAETVLAGLLNHIHGWNLVNANAITRNSAGVDLIDPANRISVQVTSTNTLQKLDHTLEQFEGKKLDADYDRLIHLVISTDNPTATMKQRTRSTWFSGSNDLWNIPELLAQIQTVNIGKLEIIADYLNREVAAFGQYVTESHLYLPPLTALGDDFVGREAELQSVHSQIFSRKPVYLSGLGGMGKTELAVRFAREYSGGTVYFAHFSESFTKTITAMFSGVYPRLPNDQPQPSETERYNTVISLLEKCGEKDILIIDNMDANQSEWNDLMCDPAYKKLCSMKLRLLITTRFEHDRAIPINRMEDETLFEIFKKHGTDLTEAEMIDLIDEVNGHTMTIDLIARTLNGKGWRKVTAEMMLTALREHTLPNENYRKIATDYNQSEEQAQIYQHLSTVFDVTGMTKICENVMRYATLLPENGMFGELFGTSLKDEEQKALDSLLEHGWLEMKDDLLMIHPVIRLVCRTELEPTEENCGDFLNALWEQFDENEYEQVKYAQLAEVFSLAAKFLKDNNAQWSNTGGHLFLLLAQHENAKVILERILPRIDSKQVDSDMSAAIYHDLGVTYSKLGKYDLSLKYRKRALKIGKNSIHINQTNLSAYYLGVGCAYCDLGDYDEALKHQLNGMEILDNIPSVPERLTASAYNLVSLTYMHLGRYSEALDLQEKSLKIRKTILDQYHPDIAISYDNLANIHEAMGDHQKALDNRLIALGIFETKLGEDHPDLAISYDGIGHTYANLRKYPKALHFQMKALRIKKSILSDDNPNLAVSYYNVGNDYFFMGKFEEALPYLEKAHAVLQKSFPNGQEHIDTVTALVQQCNDAIRMKENMSKTSIDFSKPLPPLPFIK